ncbi:MULTISPECIES: membrane protein insertase YidC [Acidobacterium]|uniref:Membrane protein insertase YidC n=1 Tax=Acidobacterium capsulatum (strain ATCC 51196 / DSM 11244 / BCRC 80197 / JCM 7670 / NBRC 15755 / NCIMB 13165 / 161) TaxID=240015 RepID=C1F9G1_ACIC5|nr:MULTISPECIES: membrane protein insertase YidC [Acidobacterium]ACO32496.1 membrane protein [Acidobacterium capsulatum ATCC 51196]HCT62173.1 membrane protein insertase YidC [Acidobacterium sp.]
MPEIQNPNQQSGGPDSRTLLIYAVIFLAIFLGLQYFRSKNAPPAPPNGKHTPAAQKNSPAPSAAPASAPGQTASGNAPAAATTPAVLAAAETTTTVESPLYRVTFTNRGGVAKSWILKKYTNDAQNRPLDMVNDKAAQQFGYPLSLYTYDAALTQQLNQAMYVPSATGTIQAPATLTFRYSANGLTVEKTFRFEKSYVLETDVKVTRNGAPVTALLAWPSGFGDQETLPQYQNAQIDQETGAKTGFHLAGGPNVKQIEPKKVSGGDTVQGPLDYAGVSDLYFASIFLPPNPDNALMVTLHHALELPRDPAHPKTSKMDQVPVLGAAVGSTTGEVHDRLFVGPKALDVLKSIHTAYHFNLEGIVHYGFWGWIAKPMFLVLQFFHNHGIPNWGWAILLLTLILNAAMMPTRVTMMKKSLAMMRIQPQMDAIKAKYAKYKATDPRKQEMNKEMMDLQKREGINMFAGCLPMLLQYPLLIGFYRMLEVTIALRHAHWMWLPDLSAPDPYYILPIFVVVSMFLVQFFTPSPGVDPAQQRMMAFMMPAFFGFMMLHIGSGVALYWAGGNILGVGQQWVMNSTGMGREMKELAAKRAARKRAQGGKVINARR